MLSGYDLTNFAEYAPIFYRSPSSHNTQPWVLEYFADKIVLLYDPERTLPEYDSSGRDLFLSLGAFIETVLITASNKNIPLDFQYHFNEENSLQIGYFFLGNDLYKTNYTINDILNRRTARGGFVEGISFDLLQELKSISYPLETYFLHGSDAQDLLYFADNSVYKDTKMTSDLLRWFRFSKSGTDSYKDGVGIDALNMGYLHSLVLRLIVLPTSRLFRFLGIFNLLALLNQTYIQENDTMIALGMKIQSKKDNIEAGRCMQRVWLWLAQKGLYVFPQSQIIDNAQCRLRLQDLVSAPSEITLFSVFSCGKVDYEPAKTPRLIQ